MTISSWIIFAAVLLILPVASVAQQSEDVHAAGSNLLRVGDGTTNLANQEVDKHYLEEIANARLFFQYFSIGLRYEMDDPSEVGRSYSNREFRRRWITYRKDQLEIQAGDIPALFGRGLAINLFESRPLNYDSWLDGVFAKSEYKVPKELLNIDASITAQGIGGQEDFYPIPATNDTATPPPQHISATAANAEFGLFKKKLVLGTSFVQAFTSITVPITTKYSTVTNRQVDEPEFYADLNSGDFEAFAEWTENRTQASIADPLTPIPDTSHTGHALYGSLSYSNAVFGLTFEYKDYQYYRHAPTDQYTNAFSKLPITSPPEVYKDFTYTTITRTTHAVNFDDELGYQLEANINAIPHVTINLYGAASSSHDKYSDSNTVVESAAILPKLKDQGFYPFWEYFGEVEWEFDPSNELNYAKIALHRRSDVIVYDAATPNETDYRSATTIAAKTQYETTPNQSLLAIVEHQWAYDVAALPDHNRLNDLITLQYSFNPTITFGFLFDHSNGSDPGGADLNPHLGLFDGFNHDDGSWKDQGFISLRLGGSHTLLASYGAERGGINCTGGICRVVPPFKGLRLTLTSQI